jgi:phosphoglycolate phosphatase
MPRKVIIFDFDGTVADTLDVILGIANGAAEEFGYKQVSREELEELKGLTPRQIIKRSGVSIFKVPFILRRIKTELNKQIQYITPFSGIKETLRKLKQQGHKLGIITSNSEENVMDFLEINDLKDLFDFVYSGTTIFGKSKVIANCLRKGNFNPADVIYVGDETRDIEAAKKTQIKVISVAWGFNLPAALESMHPDFLIYQPQELLGAIASLPE